MALTKKEQREILWMEDELLRRRCVGSFAEFVRWAWPIVEPNTPFVDGWHIDAIGMHLEASLHGQVRNLLINMPPRHMKSTLIGVMFPAWVWLRFPSKKFLYSAYAESLSVRDSVKCRMLIESYQYRKLFNPPWTMAKDQNAKGRFMNTMMGYRLSTSVGGTATGEGGDFIIADDPHNAKEIHSDDVRNGVLQWWDEVMSSRGNDPKTVVKIIVMQRLHELDLAGHVLKKGGYTHLILPAEYEGNKNKTELGWEDPREEPGELLWPNRFGRVEIEQLKKDLGSMASAGQLQQRPSNAKGNIVQRGWWKFWRELPRLDVEIQSWDFAVKDKKTNDPTCGLAMGRKGADKYLFDQYHARVNFPAACQAVVTFSNKHKRTYKKVIEPKANGPAVVATLKKTVSGLVEVEPLGDKVMRLNAVAPDVEAGNWWLPDPSLPGMGWVHDFIEELAAFPNGANDDRVDAFSQGAAELRKMAPARAPVAGHGTGTIY